MISTDLGIRLTKLLRYFAPPLILCAGSNHFSLSFDEQCGRVSIIKLEHVGGERMDSSETPDSL